MRLSVKEWGYVVTRERGFKINKGKETAGKGRLETPPSSAKLQEQISQQEETLPPPKEGEGRCWINNM